MTREGWSATLVFGVLAALAAIVVVRARYTADLSAFLPRAPTEGQRLLTEELRAGFASRLLMVAIEGGDPGTRARIAADLARRLRADPAFVEVSDGDSAGFARTASFLLGHRYLLSDAVTPQRFTAAGLHSAIGDTLDSLASPEGLIAKPLFTSDPTGETLHILDGLNPPRIATLNGVWSSRDGRRALLIAQTAAAGTDTDGQEQACLGVRGAFAAAAARTPATPALRLELSGPGAFAVSARAVIRGQVIRLSAISALLIAALLLAAYRSATALLLTFIPVASGALAGVTAVALGFDAVHGITLGFGVTLIGEAVDYAIYLFIQSGGADVAAWRRGVWPTIRLGMLTSVCGFAALVPSGFQGLAQLGLFSIAGLAAAALVTRYVLPHWRPAILQTRDLTALGASLARILNKLRPGRAALALLALLCGLVLFAHRATLFSRELTDLSPIPTADQDRDASLRADLGTPDARYLVVVSSPDSGAALESAEAIARRLTTLADTSVIGGFESPTRFLPSPASQRARQASLPAADELSARLREALVGLPVSAQRLAPFLRDVAQARTAPLLTARDLSGTPLASAVDALLTASAATTTAFLPIAPAQAGELSTTAIAAVRSAVDEATRVPPPPPVAGGAALREFGPPPVSARLLDLKAEADDLYAHYLGQAVSLSLVGLAAILLLLAVTRSPLQALRVVTPLALAVLTVAAGLALAGERLGILHVVGMLLIVAVGSNYALFFDRLAQHARGEVPRILASLAVANLATVMGFGVLAFSSVPVLAALGRTTAPGALLALVFSALLAPRAALESQV
jgi:predicted exporter